MQFLLIVGSSLLEDRAPMYEIIGSATTICALAWLDVKTAFLGPNATRLRCILPLDGPSREAFVWQGTMPAGVARGMRGLRPPSHATLTPRMYEPSQKARCCGCATGVLVTPRELWSVMRRTPPWRPRSLLPIRAPISGSIASNWMVRGKCRWTCAPAV